MSRVSKKRIARNERQRRRSRSLRVETLESRRCLAANLGLALGAGQQLQVDPTWQDESSIIVRFHSETSSGRVDGTVFGPTRTLPPEPLGFGLQRIELRPGVSAKEILDRYQRNADVVYAEPDYRVRIAAIPDDPSFGDQWGFHNTGQGGGVADADIDAPEAWDVSTGTGSTIVAVIDTGVDYLHTDLAPNMWTNPGEIAGDQIDNDNNGYVDDVYGYDFFNNDPDPMDDHDHGTHVAGTIGAEGNDGIGVAGVNWGVQIMALKFLGADGSGTTSDAIEAVSYAVDNGAQISNNSWGGDPYSQALYDVISDARDVGHIFVAAAGNGNFIGIGQNNDANPFYPASYDLDNVVAVAATDRSDQRGFFSNYGATSVDLGAPGVDILSTTAGGGYGNSSGTSMAAPHVAGALSLVRDYDPTLNYQQIIDRVLLSADPIEALDGITVTGARLNLASSLIPDETGPQVATVDPSGLVLDPFNSLRITFNESIDASSFTLADVVELSGPQGAIAATSLQVVSGSSGRQFDLTFPVQSTAGTYQLVIGPDIVDRFGNVMDQDGDGTGGEAIDDRFVHSLDKVDTVARFDFGTSTSPVAANYVGVTGSNSYSAATGYGWQSGAVYSLSRGGEPLTQDFNYTTEATFALDVPNGEYDVIVTLGESIVAHDQMGVLLEGVQVDSVSTAAGQFAVNTYRTSVSDGQLNVGLKDLGGSDPWVMINGLDVVFAGPDTSGPSVIETDAVGTLTGPIDRLSVTFDEPIQPASLTLADVSLQGPAGVIAPTGINAVSAGEFEITFDSQNESGSYQLTIGPDVLDIAGNTMDQDGDGVNGEAIDDRFDTTFTLEAGLETVARFDFGTLSSPVASGYTQITTLHNYNATTGYGWQSGPVSSVDRAGDAVTRDLNYTTDGTFAVDLANGEYDLVITMGELLIPHDQMGVIIEGVQVDLVDTAGGQFAVNTYRTSISDGQLNLQVKDLGGSNPYAVINGLEIVYAGPDTSGPSVIATDATGTRIGPIDRLSVTFDEPIQAESLTLADFSLQGPLGVITPTGINSVSAGEFEITFDQQNESGSYQLVVGPDVLDIAGNAMDQDGDGTGGEAIDDQFDTTFTLEAGLETVARFDFGTLISPVATGYTQITTLHNYNASAGYGWQSGAVSSVDRSGDALTRDLNYTADASFAVDLPNGEYDVVITMGEVLIPHDQMGVFVEGVHVDSVDTAGGQFAVNTYRTSISDGQLNLTLTDLGGSNPYVAINGLEIVYAGPDTSGPSVIATDANGTLTGPIDRVSVNFDEAIQVASFTLADVALQGPTGSITPTGINAISAGAFEITFDPQNEAGLYQLVIGPDVLDIAGNAMDQDDDGVNGEATDDQFDTTFTLQAGFETIARFDFGTTYSALEDGYTRVTSTDGYDAATGHGWQTGPVYSISWGGSPLTQDLNYTADGTFAVDLSNGEYDVIVTMGEALIAHDQMGVFIEDVHQDTVSTASFQFKTNTYRTIVSDGQLNVRIHDLGGSNSWAVINAMEIVYVGP